MKFLVPLLLSLVLVLGGCNKAPKNNDAIRRGVLEHISKNTGLDVNAMNVDVQSVNYRGTEADAVVTFRPKASPNDAMTMNYTLETQGNKWVVKKKPGSMGAHPGAQTAMPGAMPPNHPGVGGEPTAGAGEALPPGHPPVPDSSKK